MRQLHAHVMAGAGPPSTSLFATAKDMDAGAKPRHDELQRSAAFNGKYCCHPDSWARPRQRNASRLPENQYYAG